MTIELRYLLLATALGMVHVLATGMASTMHNGVAYGLGARDEKKEVPGIGGRVRRAFDNFMQSFPFFAAAILVAQALGRHGSLTELGAQLYFWARLVYIPLYAFNVSGVRTVAWGAAMAGIVLVLIGAA